MLSGWLNELKRLAEILRRMLNLIKKTLCKVSLWVLILLIILLGTGIIWLNSPTIHFDGVAEKAAFSFVADRQAAYSIRCDNSNNSEIKFGADRTATIYVVSASVPEDLIEEIQEGGFTDWESSNEIFPFIDGSATLFSGALMNLMLELPEGGSFTYDMEITRDEGKTDGERNRVELKNFSEDLVIQLGSAYDISMKGNTKVIPKGLYRIIGCTTITFYAVPSASKDSEIDFNSHVKGTLKHFKFVNAEMNTMEVTYFAETNSNEVGHVLVEGSAEKAQGVTLGVSDIGQYPIPIMISGQVKSLEIAGANAKPNMRQWLFERRSELLMLIVGGYITFLVGTAFGKKTGSKTEE